MTERIIEIMPAYGRTYRTLDEVREAWNSNKDFTWSALNFTPECGGTYVSRSGAELWDLTPVYRGIGGVLRRVQ